MEDLPTEELKDLPKKDLPKKDLSRKEYSIFAVVMVIISGLINSCIGRIEDYRAEMLVEMTKLSSGRKLTQNEEEKLRELARIIDKNQISSCDDLLRQLNLERELSGKSPLFVPWDGENTMGDVVRFHKACTWGN